MNKNLYIEEYLRRSQGFLHYDVFNDFFDQLKAYTIQYSSYAYQKRQEFEDYAKSLKARGYADESNFIQDTLQQYDMCVTASRVNDTSDYIKRKVRNRIYRKPSKLYCLKDVDTSITIYVSKSTFFDIINKSWFKEAFKLGKITAEIQKDKAADQELTEWFKGSGYR